MGDERLAIRDKHEVRDEVRLYCAIQPGMGERIAAGCSAIV